MFLRGLVVSIVVNWRVIKMLGFMFKLTYFYLFTSRLRLLSKRQRRSRVSICVSDESRKEPIFNYLELCNVLCAVLQ